MDALVGNFDRHGSNWGFIKEKNKYTLAPVFDNGSSLFPNLTDEDEMEYIMCSPEETDKRIYKFPTSQIRLNKTKSSYYDIISSHRFEECNRALVRVFQRIDLNKIKKMIDATPLITETQKKFYMYMVKERYNKILKESYEKLQESW